MHDSSVHHEAQDHEQRYSSRRQSKTMKLYVVSINQGTSIYMGDLTDIHSSQIS